MEVGMHVFDAADCAQIIPNIKSLAFMMVLFNIEAFFSDAQSFCRNLSSQVSIVIQAWSDRE